MVETLYLKNKNEWRAWLEKYHKSKDSVWLVKYKKHTGKPTLTNREAMDEAICFGWIDTIVKGIDDEKYKQKFVKRKKTANWSKNTLSYGKKMIEEGRMTERGLKYYKLGLKKTPLDHIPMENVGAPQLMKALEKNPEAKEFFDSLAPSYRKQYTIWVARAKRPETVEKRVKLVIKNCKDRKKPFT